MKIKVAIAGNPNSGKTTIFNKLTGMNQSVGNYPGVTVEKVSGMVSYRGNDIELVDLPGTYGLTAFSMDEMVARDFLIHERPDVVVNVLDSSNLERSLYLTVQLMELHLPLVIIFNMSDTARAHGLVFDIKLLEKAFNSPILSFMGHKDDVFEPIMSSIFDVYSRGQSENKIKYDKAIESEIALLKKEVIADEGLRSKYKHFIDCDFGAKWLSLKLLEEDTDILKYVKSDSLRSILEESKKRFVDLYNDSPSSLIADSRYGYISGACQEAVKNTAEIRHTISDKFDIVLTHRYAGLAIFVFLMFIVFSITFRLGAPFSNALIGMFQWLGVKIGHFIGDDNYFLKSLIVDGIIGGVGGVIGFIPNIALLFMCIAFLEYSGYMARAAFVMDRVMHRMGLHGKSFIPMLIGFGCTVPAIMATRILDSRRNRLITMMILPLMSCGARLPIYALIIPAFFPLGLQPWMFMLIYFIGIITAIIMARLLGATVLRGETDSLVIELPPYRMPTFRAVYLHTWQMSWMYLKKAGTVILGFSILLWAMNTFPYPKDLSGTLSDAEQKKIALEYSISGRLGHFIEPAIKPLGFDWKIGTALISAFPAKELFVSQMSIVQSIGESNSDSVVKALSREYTPLQGFCIMLFCLLSFPCVATVAVVKSESGKWKWALFQVAGLTGLAYVLTFITYQLGRLIF